MPNLYIMAGPNGAGKTTTAYTLLPEILNVREFVNADEVENLFTLYLPICDSFLVVNNSYEQPTEVAKGGFLMQEIIKDQVLWKFLKSNYGNGN